MNTNTSTGINSETKNMKTECLKDVLKNALSQAEKMTGKNLSLPVLSGVYVSANKKTNTLSLRATNLDLGIEISFPAKVEEEGDIVVPPAALVGLLSGIYDKKASLFVEGGNLAISSINTSSLVKGIPNDGFPTLPVIQEGEGGSGESFEIPVSVFLDGVKSVWYSASTSDMKPEISSVCLYRKDDDAVFAATDSFRLSEKKIPLKNQGGKNFHLLVPHKNIIEIMRVFEGLDGAMKISFNKNQVSFSAPEKGIYITSRIIDGIFPDYEQIIPKNHSTEATLLKQDLVNALKIANIFSDKFNRVDIAVSATKKLFELRSNNAAVGENTARLDAQITGDDISLGFNHKYILDCFQSIKQESVTLHFAGAGKPMVLRGAGDKSFLSLIMPLSV